MVLVCIVVSSKHIAIINKVSFPKHFDRFANLDLLCCEKIFSVCLTRLIESKLKREFLPPEGYRKRIFTRVGWVDLSHLNRVICKEEVYDKVAVF
jgi:hypothetical protein